MHRSLLHTPFSFFVLSLLLLTVGCGSDGEDGDSGGSTSGGASASGGAAPAGSSGGEGSGGDGAGGSGAEVVDCATCGEVFASEVGCVATGCPIKPPSRCETTNQGATCRIVVDCTCPYTMCSSDDECATGSFCHFQAASCGSERNDGYCLPLDQLGASSECTAPELHDGEVCGCDGVTYAKECEALRAGTKGIKYRVPCL